MKEETLLNATALIQRLLRRGEQVCWHTCREHHYRAASKAAYTLL